MRSARTHIGIANRPVAVKAWPRVALLACGVTIGLFAIVLGVRVAVQRIPSSDTGSLTTVGITPVMPPKPLPTFAFTDEGGHRQSLADFQGRAVALNLWATWCVPCREEMPSLDRLQAKLGGARFEVVAVSIDRQGAAVVRAFYENLGLQSLAIHLDLSGKAPSVLGIDGVPATVLIDAQGREIGLKLGALEWDSQAVIDLLRRVFRLTDIDQAASEARNERSSP